jgi:hypothetical protein
MGRTTPPSTHFPVFVYPKEVIMSEFYETADELNDEGAPVELVVYKGIRSGDKVTYVGPMVLEGEFTVQELIQFTTNDVLCIMRDSNGDVFEVNADNVERV